MAVVPGADETILGAAPGSPFPGNFLGTQMTPSLRLGFLDLSVLTPSLLPLSHPSGSQELPAGRQQGFRTNTPFHPVSLAWPFPLEWA